MSTKDVLTRTVFQIEQKLKQENLEQSTRESLEKNLQYTYRDLYSLEKRK